MTTRVTWYWRHRSFPPISWRQLLFPHAARPRGIHRFWLIAVGRRVDRGSAATRDRRVIRMIPIQIRTTKILLLFRTLILRYADSTDDWHFPPNVRRVPESPVYRARLTLNLSERLAEIFTDIWCRYANNIRLEVLSHRILLMLLNRGTLFTTVTSGYTYTELIL